MPKATVSTEVVHRELKSAPPDGFVDLLPLPFGRILKRRDMAAKTYMPIRDQVRNGDITEEEADEMRWEMMQEKTRMYEFKHCIVDHNLEDEAGRKLDFKREEDVLALDPKIGQEIEKFLDELNAELTPEEERNFRRESSDSSETTPETSLQE